MRRAAKPKKKKKEPEEMAQLVKKEAMLLQ